VQNVSGITTRQGELFPGVEPGPQFPEEEQAKIAGGNTARVYK
jgi:hypothetical protein